MTNAFAAKMIRLAGTAVLASILASSAGAENSEPKTMFLFFDMQSADLTPEAKSIVLSAVDAAERDHAGQIELAVFAAPDESMRDHELVVHRAAILKQQIADYGFQGVVIIDDEAPNLPLAKAGDETIDRRAVIRVGR